MYSEELRDSYAEARMLLGVADISRRLTEQLDAEKQKKKQRRDKALYYGSAALIGILLRVLIKFGLL